MTATLLYSDAATLFTATALLATIQVAILAILYEVHYRTGELRFKTGIFLSVVTFALFYAVSVIALIVLYTALPTPLNYVVIVLGIGLTLTLITVLLVGGFKIGFEPPHNKVEEIPNNQSQSK